MKKIIYTYETYLHSLHTRPNTWDHKNNINHFKLLSAEVGNHMHLGAKNNYYIVISQSILNSTKFEQLFTIY